MNVECRPTLEACLFCGWRSLTKQALKSSRAYIERNAIGLLSNNMRPFDPPSKTWLGLHSHASKYATAVCGI